MSADAASSEICPDPSAHHAHQHSSRLQEQASTAALYATQPNRGTEPRDAEQQQPANILDADGKLSSQSAAASLKHAKPQDLPSFPSSGNTANSASKAALLAKDYKMDPLWHPEQSAAGSKAALLAHGKGGKVELWQATATSDGHSAATLAMRNKSLSPKVDYGVNAENKNKALLAATMSHNKGRQRAGSTPSPAPPAYPDAQNSSANALNAAAVSHRASTLTSDGWDSQANQAARIKNSHIDPAMFGDRPPVEIEREEAKHQAALRASAVSMAKQIMQTQDRSAMTTSTDPADIAGAQAAASRTSPSSQSDIKQEAIKYINLQEAAHKLAAERLAKVDKNFEAAQYREYYGYSDKPKRLSSRLSMRSSGGRQRKRASSEGTADLDDSDDEGQARRIRSQMSQLNTGLSKLDEKKQQDDRAKLLAAAEKSVSARMHQMDERVFADTGKIPPALLEEWEEKARQRAQQEREQQAQNPGKTHVGGGKFMDQSEIEAIAAARLKPTLDEISTNAEKKRARDEELRQEKEEQERQKRDEKAKNKEEKEEQKRLKNEEKARKEEEKRVAKEEKRKSRDIKRETAAAGAAGVALAEVAEKVKDSDEPATGDATEGVQRHRSTLDRLKDRFRKSHAGESQPEHRDQETATKAVETGAATSSSEAGPEKLDAQQAAHAASEEDETAKIPVVSEPVSAVEPTEQTATRSAEHVDDDADDEEEVDKWKPVVVPTTAALTAAAAAATSPEIHVEDADVDTDADDEFPASSSKPARPPFEQKPSLSGYHNDEIPVLSEKPDLERHISQIPESDGDSSDDDDWDDERKPLGQGRAQAVAERVATAPVVNTDEPPIPSEGQLAQMDDQRAEPPKDLPSTLDSPGVPKAMPATEPLTKPVTTDPQIQLETDADQKDHTILRQVLNPHGKKYDEQGYGTTAHAATVSDDSRSKETAEPAKLKKKQESTDATKSEDKDRKGFRGFFSKLRHKESKPENQSSETETSSESKGVAYESTKAREQPTTVAKEGTETASPTTTLPPVDVGPSLGERVGTDGPIGDSEHVSGLGGNPRAESPSSFKKGEAALNDPDDVSSSGVDEEDISRGRAGRLARKLGLGSRKSKDEGKTGPRASGEDKRQNSEGTEDEQYEEARDHFDENLAPPPAFAGQAKSESPVRETRFQEQL